MPRSRKVFVYKEGVHTERVDKKSVNRERQAKLCIFFSLSLSFAMGSNLCFAGARDQAKRIHDRLAGIPPTSQFLDTYAVDANTDGDLDDPQNVAAQAINHPAFYNVTLKNFAAPMTNEEQSVFVPLNDYTATVIGMIRDNRDYRDVLSADILYVGNSSLGLPDYANDSNAHYEALENQGINLQANLVAATQSSTTGLPAAATSGVLTTRAGAKTFFKDGTNRAMFRFTLINHLCTDLEQLKDTSRATDRIRQDVTRSPGGDSRLFLNACMGCHAGMDPLAQAYAYYDYRYDEDSDPDGESGQLSYNTADMIDPDTGIRVKKKYHINGANFKWGYITPDDHWDNYWRNGPNALLGWDETLSGSGEGAKSMGTELAHSNAFAQCQVRKVFKAVCLREPSNAADRSQVEQMLSDFKTSDYNMKTLFSESAVYCMGD